MEENYFIEYNGEKVEFVLEKAKRKTIGIQVKENGEVIVKAPVRMANYKILEFVNSKNKWIYEKHIEQKSKYKKEEFIDGAILKVLGIDYKLTVVECDENYIKVGIVNDTLTAFVPKVVEEKERAIFIEKAYNKFLFKIAEDIIPKEMNKISNVVGLYPNEIKIRNFKRAWGNCSSKKVISLNKNLCKYDIEAIDYVCLHEICHLKYMNHSKDFWNMVGRYMSNYKLVEKRLK